ncbi:uncharacterized protein LOC104904516 [Beta vulgaris subsp. vulgaris]|uniref:uncharacterized protein LOC104904516 n=1 Tax=Beta vulgaris subsp. vulgaris TaxID=3555 RepID=UPI002036A9C3|nr:uncharacterized protein LOC104904516 [Beta vulgaris subsp. vulgaris]
MAGDDIINPPPPPLKIDASSPFFLGPQDRPGDFITPTRLTHENYADWAADVQLALVARRKFVFVDGTISSPVPPCTESDWLTINAMLVSWITNTITPEVKSTLTKYREARRLWDHLKHRFSIVNGPRIQQIKSSISRCEQTKNMPVSTYYGKLNALWEELSLLEPPIRCSCCSTCNVSELYSQRHETTKLHEFLMGLNSDYFSHLRSTILSSDPLPTIDRAYHLAVQDERVRVSQQSVVEPPAPTDVVGFSVKASRPPARGSSSSGGRVVCGKCHKNGHDSASCWAHLTCSHCHKKGHDSTHCYELHGYPDKTKGPASRPTTAPPARAHAAVSTPVSSSAASGSSPSSSSLFTADQWTALAGLFGNAQVPSNRLNGPHEGADWNGD